MKKENFALEIKQLSVVYDTAAVLWQVDVSIPRGNLVGILGPNGAGKSTFLKAITGLVKPISGHIACLGRPYREVRDQVAYVPQRTAVDWDFPVSVFDVVSMGCFGRKGLFRRIDAKDRRLIEKALSDLGLSSLANRQIKELSGGQQQKVFLARALVQQAEIYLMDEPFSGVDLATEKVIIAILQELRAQGKTIVLVHHDLYSVVQYFDWVVLLNTALVDSGPVKEVFSKENLSKTYGEHFSLFETKGA
ncbi:MAG: metal ABC transporter ATP-binding protein [Chlamydiota bacterium]